jgi:hypothetical protein
LKTVDIIGRVVEAIDNTFTASSIVDNGDGTYTLETCDTLHLQEGFSLTIDGEVYKIVTVNADTSIVLSGTVLPTLTSFEIYPPVYFHGTVIKTMEDMKRKKRNSGSDYLAIMPFIYLKEVIRDTNYPKGSGNAYEKESELQIFFLTHSNFKDWSTVDHYEKSIDQMTNLVGRFIVAAQNEKLIGRFEGDSFDTTNHTNFGVYVTSKGHTKSIFVDELSGVEMSIRFPFYAEPCTDC